MAHKEQLQFFGIVRESFPDLFQARKVLEIGSWDKNGSVRGLFQYCQYTGVDVADGPGVDLVRRGQDLDFPTCTFDTVISGECFEHNRFWLETLVNMIRMLQPGGLCILTCAGKGRAEHGTPRVMSDSSLTSLNNLDNYYCNLSKRDITSRIDLAAHFEAWSFARNLNHQDLFFVGVKRGCDTKGVRNALESVAKRSADLDSLENLPGLGRWRTYVVPRLRYILESILGGHRFHNLEFLIRGIVK